MAPVALLTTPLLVLVSAVLLAYTQPALVDTAIGRIHIDHTRLARWSKAPWINNEACQRFDTANGCEDVKIHHKSSLAFLACGDPVERGQWYPPAGVHTESKRKSFRESLHVHDLKTSVTKQLKLVGLDGDFVTHGMDIFDVPGDSSKIRIFAVNHARAGDSISIFEHRLGTDEAVLVKDVKHPGIKTANGVAAVGLLQFFTTNDHYFARGWPRFVEERLGPWSWASDVQYCDASGESVQCHRASRRFPNCNGISVDGDTLYVGDARNGTMTIFDIGTDNMLIEKQQVDLGAGADNIKVLPSKDPIIAVFPAGLDLPTYLSNPEHIGKDLKVHAGLLQLRKDQNYSPEMIYHDDGSVLSFMTAADVSPELGVLVGAAIVQYGGFAVCKVDGSKF